MHYKEAKEAKNQSATMQIRIKNQCFIAMEVEYTDITGLKYWYFHSWLMGWLGVRPTIFKYKLYRFLSEIFGILIFIMCTFQMYVGIASIKIIFEEMDMKKIVAIISFISLYITSISKFFVYKKYSSSVVVINEWIKKVMKNRVTGRPFGEKIYIVIGHFLHVVTTITFIAYYKQLFLHRKLIVPSLFPKWSLGIMDRFSFIMQGIIYTFVACIACYGSCVLLNALSIYCTELRDLVKQWSNMHYDRTMPNEYKKLVKENVEKHLELLKIKKEIANLHEALFAAQIIVTIILMSCLILNPAKTASILSIIPASVVSILIFGLKCWYGEIITFERAVYRTNWFESPVTVRKHVIILQEFMKKEQSMTGAKVFKASLRTFAMGVREAVSLYTLVNALKDKQKI